MKTDNRDKIKIERINRDNFKKTSLDDFVLNQRVTRCWRKVNGNYELLPVSYTEKWNLNDKRAIAQMIINSVENGAVAFAARKGLNVVGFALLEPELFGSKNQYKDLSEFYASEPFRRLGIGKKLFEAVCNEAKTSNAKKLYISAHSAEESIAAYKKYGCVLAKEPDVKHMEKEPFDLQLEYDLSERIYEVSDKNKYMDLLLLGDEQREMVEKYLPDGKMFVIDDCGVKGEITVTGNGDNVLEIKNLAVLPEFQRRGYGKKLVEFVCERYKSEFSAVTVGTGDSPLTLPFYEKCGFTFLHRVKNFFKENYDHPIFESGILLTDMIYLIKYL